MISTIVNASTTAAQFWFLIAAIIFILSLVIGVVTRTQEGFVWLGGVVLTLGLAAISLGLLYLA